MYVGEEDGRVYSLSACLPVEETLNLDGIANGDKLCLKWEIEDLSIHIIHSLSSSCLANTTMGNASVTRSMRVSSAISCLRLQRVTIRRHVAWDELE